MLISLPEFIKNLYCPAKVVTQWENVKISGGNRGSNAQSTGGGTEI